jgi:hypothetical protein
MKQNKSPVIPINFRVLFLDPFVTQVSHSAHSVILGIPNNIGIN